MSNEARPADNCCSTENGSIIARRENLSRFALLNKSHRNVKVCQVDGCLIKDPEPRCDWLFDVDQGPLFLIELKGTDISHAVDQIINTAELLKARITGRNAKSFIVSASTPKAKTTLQTAIIKNLRRFKAANVTPPIQKNGNLEIVI